MPWTTLCDINELTDGAGKYVEIDGFQLAVFLSGGTVYVMDNYCPHAGGNLAGGVVRDGCAVCPWHNWAFRLENGQLRDSPGCVVRTYAVRTVEHAGKPLIQANLPLP